jgi:hypothetical protein
MPGTTSGWAIPFAIPITCPSLRIDTIAGLVPMPTCYGIPRRGLARCLAISPESDFPSTGAFTIILWWTAFESVLYLLDGTHFALLFLTIWIIAKATVFHAITTFREMNDHYGLESGGIFRHTRETPNLGLLSVLLHPHHNGYHLTHHLFPHVPYYHLPRTHARLRQIPFFEQLAIVCDDYVKGPNACVDGWGHDHG